MCQVQLNENQSTKAKLGFVHEELTSSKQSCNSSSNIKKEKKKGKREQYE